MGPKVFLTATAEDSEQLDSRDPGRSLQGLMVLISFPASLKGVGVSIAFLPSVYQGCC